jgi:hypothetical protein
MMIFQVWVLKFGAMRPSFHILAESLEHARRLMEQAAVRNGWALKYSVFPGYNDNEA